MTKRFRYNVNQNSIEDYAKLKCYVNTVDGFKIANLLNTLHEENTYLKLELDTHKHPLWSTREAERIVNELKEENGQLKKELSEYKDFVLSDDKILCYTCLFCTHKGIYEVDCDVKGHVDVHGTCHCYTKKELEE